MNMFKYTCPLFSYFNEGYVIAADLDFARALLHCVACVNRGFTRDTCEGKPRFIGEIEG